MSAQIAQFPRRKKRGAKVKHGPCATILAFPVPLAGDDLRELWYWLFKNHNKWNNEELTGSEPDWRQFFGYLTMSFVSDPPTDGSMRNDVPKWQAEIRKRTMVKDWLETLGIDWDEVRNPEEALTFVFDCLSKPKLPASA